MGHNFLKKLFSTHVAGVKVMMVPKLLTSTEKSSATNAAATLNSSLRMAQRMFIHPLKVVSAALLYTTSTSSLPTVALATLPPSQ